MRYFNKFSVLQTSGNIINQHTTAFENTENDCLWHLQNIDNQYLNFYQILSYSTGFDREKDSLRLNPQSEGLCGARLTSPLDLFTRFYYFGARYYDCDLSGLFLSVDPMADKYPSLSPYAYCAWNPIKIVDPNGDSLYALDASSQNDLRSIAGEYSDMLKFDDRGNVLLDYRGRDKNQINTQHEGIGLLSSIIDSDCKILYEASDIALMRTVDGSKICGYMDDKETGVMNLSTFGFDSNNSLSYLPREGYDGQVVVSLSGEWIGVENGTKNRTEIVSHELAENYARTVLGYDYNGKPSAHNYANERMKNPNKSYYYKGFKLTKTPKKQYDSKLTQYFGY